MHREDAGTQTLAYLFVQFDLHLSHLPSSLRHRYVVLHKYDNTKPINDTFIKSSTAICVCHLLGKNISF